MAYRNDETPKIMFSTPKGQVIYYERNGAYVKCEIKWNPGFGPRFTDGFRNAQQAFAQEVAKKMDKYVPYLNGPLKNSVHIASDYDHGLLVYATPYARRQYYLHPQGQGIHDGHRGSYWGQRCIADNKEHFSRFVKKAVQKELGKG